MVYIHEAHPADGWQVLSNVRESVVVPAPKTSGERTQIANTCAFRLGLEIPALVDDLDDGTDRAYTAWPDRFYLVARDGTVAFKSPPGPFGFSANEVRAQVTALLAASR